MISETYAQVAPCGMHARCLKAERATPDPVHFTREHMLSRSDPGPLLLLTSGEQALRFCFYLPETRGARKGEELTKSIAASLHNGATSSCADPSQTGVDRVLGPNFERQFCFTGLSGVPCIGVMVKAGLRLKHID